MSISTKKEIDWFGILVVVVIVFWGLAFIWAVFQTPAAVETRERLQELFRQNRVEAVQEYEADEQRRKAAGDAGSIETTGTPAEAPVR